VHHDKIFSKTYSRQPTDNKCVTYKKLFAMNYTHELTRLLKFVREIDANCRLNMHQADGPLVLSKSLIATALNDLKDADVDTLIESLEVERYIQQNRNGHLVFPASLIEADSWISNYADYSA
jgi:hypothetical protein